MKKCFTLGKTALALSLLAVLGIANTVNAAALTYSATIDPTLTDWNFETLQLQKFDSSLGELTGIQISTTLTLSTILTVTNSSPDASNGNAGIALQLAVVDPGSFIGDSTKDSGGYFNAPTIDYSKSNVFSYTLASGDSLTGSPYNKTVSSNASYSDIPTLTEFTGTDNISLNLFTVTKTVQSNTGGNTAESQTTTASSTVTVTYLYNAVPEPTQWALLVTSGMAFLGFQRLRLRRS